jgi:hypothetical protein
MPLDKAGVYIKTMTEKLLLTILFLLIGLMTTFGQNELTGKYILTDYPGSYILLNADKTFKFRYRSHAYWDLACGQFEVKNDTIFFTYTSDMFDLSCNSEKINMTDTSDYFLQTGVDKTYRPVIATFKKKEIRTIKTGDTTDLATIDRRTYYYKRERKRHER